MDETGWAGRPDGGARHAASLVLSSLHGVLGLTSLVDIGSGPGFWLDEAARLGLDAVGVDRDGQPRAGMRRTTIHDVSRPFGLGRRFDLALCLEVGEHLAAGAADILLDNLLAHSDVVLFGAAIPFQGGEGHVTERWPSWWRAKFAMRGCVAFDVVRPLVWDEPGVPSWCKQSVLLYVHRSRPDVVEALTAFIARRGLRELPIDVVHPAFYEARAADPAGSRGSKVRALLSGRLRPRG